MTQTDMRHLMTDDELDAVEVMVLEIRHLEEVRHKNDILPSQDKRRKSVHDTVFLRQIDLRDALQAESSGKVLNDLIDLGEILLRDADGIRTILRIVEINGKHTYQRQKNQNESLPCCRPVR